MCIQDTSNILRAEVYWIFDDSCTDILTDGYVGVSKDANNRFKSHLLKNRVPQNSKMKVVYSGNRDECFKIEALLRPFRGIGWNSAVGGKNGFQIGFIHSDETKSKLKTAWTEERKSDHRKRISLISKSLKGQKRPKQSQSISGVNNPMFGKNHSEETKQKISEINQGRTPYNKSEIYCIGCRKKSPLSKLSTHHNKCFKNYRNSI